MVHVVWLLNYYAWGFNFAGYQLTVSLLWLAGIVLIYAGGCRLGGRGAGLVAALLLGLNDIHLLLPSWKSWTTVLCEFAAVAGWFWCFRLWREKGLRRWLVGWLAFAALGALSKESVPLVVLGGLFMTYVCPRFLGETGLTWQASREAWLRALYWFVAAARHSYGAAVVPGRCHRRARTQPAPGPNAVKDVSLRYLVPRFSSHTYSLFTFGVSRYLFLFALLAALWRGRGMARRLGARHLRVFLGALVVLAILMSIPYGLHAPFGLEKWKALRLDMTMGWPLVSLAMLAGFAIVALMGDAWDRVLLAWFGAAIAPPLVFRMASNAYHMVAFAALALFTARHGWAFFVGELLPAFLKPRPGAPYDPARTPRRAVAVLAVAVGCHQAVMLAGNVGRVHNDDPKHGVLARRVAVGRANARSVRRAVEGVLADPAPDRRVWLGDDSLEWVAALELQERHGFQAALLHEQPGRWVGLRRFDTGVRVYTDALPFDAGLFSRHNALLKAGFGADAPGLLRPGSAPGDRPMTARGGDDGPQSVVRETPPVRFAAKSAFVMGGFFKAQGQSEVVARMGLRSEERGRYAVYTPFIKPGGDEWDFVWECVAPERVEGRFVLRAMEVRNLRGGAVAADGVFFCPVAPLIEKARAGTRAQVQP